MPKQYDLLVLQDAELALPGDKDAIGPDQGVMVVGLFQGLFDNWDAMMAARDEFEAAAVARVLPWQKEIPVDGFVRVRVPGLTSLVIYGDLYAPETAVAIETEAGADETEVAMIKARVEDANRRGWLYGRWYSADEPTGETGSWMRAYVDEALGELEFELARSRGWTERTDG